MNSQNTGFWQALDKLLAESEIVIDRARGSAHPRFQELVYPLDYGYLKGTSSPDGEGIDLWLGSGEKRICGAICTVDLVKKDSEIKLLIGCSEEETGKALAVHNSSPLMKGILIPRE